ncbi:MAG TPA: Asp-tRNA(Asn)/Glu-tRNA(Gln) amidotransferase subunit GatC [Candidatus Nanoarchaeia archaeon]|nr:Asp-tRNA(Asn)/Glu-tRNA(Gln) amidotransferase subunit GatC [Candidatus Nanoarchaeia archaeon]
MIERKDVEKLAALARITVPEAEMAKLQKDMGAILEYVSQINEANDLATDIQDDPSSVARFGVKNVLREDAEPHESGKYTDVLLKAAPKSQDGYIKVKKILS